MPSSPTEAKIVERFLQHQEELVLQASDLSLESIRTMVEDGSIDISPKYQRRERWDIESQSQLIESFLLNVPIPPVYLAEDDFGTYSIIDGKQRLTAIHAYLSDRFELKLLTRFGEVNGLRFSQLPRQLRNALQIRPYIRAITLLRQTNPLLKYEVFLRLNIAGKPLNPQEIRNVAYRGRYNDMIYKTAKNEFLQRQLKIKSTSSPAYQNMTDAEWALRFQMLREKWTNFTGDFRRALDSHMQSHHDDNAEAVRTAQKRFERAISACASIWKNIAFHRPESTGWRSQALAGIYDAEMISIDLLTEKQLTIIKQKRAAVIAKTRELFNDQEFADAARVATNTPAKVEYRIHQMHKTLLSVAKGS